MFLPRPALLGTALFTLIGIAASPLQAQIRVKATPYSFHTAFAEDIPTYTLPAKNATADASTVYPRQATDFLPVTSLDHRTEFNVDLGFTDVGRWQRLPDGGRLWRLRLTSEGAAGIHLIYDDFWMPPGARLFLYNEDRSVVLGAFTERNNKSYGSFSTGFVRGGTTILEYYEPADVPAPGRLHIATAIQDGAALDGAAKGQSNPPYTPKALSCSINVACSQGSGWTSPTKAVVKISNGCTGVLVNNAEADETPFVLTANHCGSPSVGSVVNWVFEFGYQSSTCADPQDTPSTHSISGATVRAASGGAADFVLLELSAPIPQEYDVYFAGWSIEDDPSATGTVIGHPRGDIKKITLDEDAITDFNSAYLRAEFDQGTIENGSSGAPFFNSDGKLVGLVSTALSLDPNACTGTGGDDNAANVLIPKLSYMWGLGVQQHLDPNGTGATSMPYLKGTGAALPVELVSFEATLNGQALELRWETASETNNAGFEIQRVSNPDAPESQAAVWENLAFVEGHGTTLDPQAYRHDVAFLEAGTHRFRLKQIDFDGAFEYSPEVEVAVGIPTRYHLSTAYPNPFNPETQFSLSVARAQDVQVGVYDVMGRRVAMLHEGLMEAQTTHAFTFGAAGLPSGLYLIRILGEQFVTSQTVTLVK